VPSTDLSQTSLLQVSVDGSSLPADIAGQLVQWTVDDSVNVPDMFELRFTDDFSHTIIDKGGFTIGAKIKLDLALGGVPAPQPLLQGEVTALETEGESGEPGYIVVRGYDMSHRLFRGRRVEAYMEMGAGDIAQKVAQRAGLQTGEISSGGPTFKHIAQDAVNDWEFLSRLANLNGYEVSVTDGKLNFRERTNSSEAPSTSESGDENALVLDRFTNLMSYRTTITAADQVPEVEVRGWDPEQKKEITTTKPAKTISAKVDGYDPAKLANQFNSPKWVESVSSLNQPGHVEKTAASLAERFAGSFAEIDAVAKGNPGLRSGKAVALTNLGKPFDGKYTISQSKHVYTQAAGYLTYVSVSNVSDRDMYGLVTDGSAESSRNPGVLTAIVTDIKDPDAKFRVKVKFPVLDGTFVSAWARTLQPGAGDKRGFVILPEVGDEVLVAFGMGSFDEPYILGGVYNGTDKPDKDHGTHVDGSAGNVTRRSLTSRNGMVLELIETSSDEKFTISTNDGEQRITLTQTADKGIEIISKGALTVTADKDISIESKQGNISMKGMGIKIEAQQDLELSATAGLKAKGATAELKGDGTVEVSAPSAKLAGSGMTEITGGLVKIN
jgi:phage protein D